MSIDRHLFRETMRQLASGVAVVTTTTGEGFHGFTANSVVMLSADPPLVLVCVERLARARDHLLKSGHFALAVLAFRQQFLADRLAGRAPGLSRRFEGVSYRTEKTGSPIPTDCLAWLDCSLEASYEAGDHTIVVGKAVAGGENQVQPLLFFRGRYISLA